MSAETKLAEVHRLLAALRCPNAKFDVVLRVFERSDPVTGRQEWNTFILKLDREGLVKQVEDAADELRAEVIRELKAKIERLEGSDR